MQAFLMIYAEVENLVKSDEYYKWVLNLGHVLCSEFGSMRKLSATSHSDSVVGSLTAVNLVANASEGL